MCPNTSTVALTSSNYFSNVNVRGPTPQNNSPALESSDLGSHPLELPPPSGKPVTTPNRGKFDSLNGTSVIKSALKSNSLAPTSALKISQRYQTPIHRKGHHRSVSFSDGKRDGPRAIRGLRHSFALRIIVQSSFPRYRFWRAISQIETNREA
jgi:hypothetical protein